MKKILSGLLGVVLGSVVAWAPVAVPSAAAADLPPSILSGMVQVFSTARTQLSVISGQLGQDQAYINTVNAQLAAVRAQLQVLASTNLDTPAERALAAQALVAAQQAVSDIGVQLGQIQTRQSTYLSWMVQLTNQFRALVSLVATYQAR